MGQHEGRQKYRPIENRDLDEAAMSGHNHRSTGPKPQRLHQKASTETHQMGSAHIPVVNPVSAGDRSTAQNSCRVYQKGKKNRTIS